MKTMKKLFTRLCALIIVTLVICGITSCGSETNGTLKIGVTDYKPMDYKEAGSDTWIGFDADLAREVGKLIGYDVEFVEINWDTKVTSINAKEIDIIWNGMTITDDLKEALLISEAYLDNKQVIVCRKSEAYKYTSKESLALADEVFAEAGSAGETVALAVENANVKSVAAQKDTLLEVKSSASKVAVIDKLMAQVVIGEGTDFEDLTYVDVGFDTEEFGIGFRKEDTELMQKVMDALKTLKENGTYQTIQSKYFG